MRSGVLRIVGDRSCFSVSHFLAAGFNFSCRFLRIKGRQGRAYFERAWHGLSLIRTEADYKDWKKSLDVIGRPNRGPDRNKPAAGLAPRAW